MVLTPDQERLAEALAIVRIHCAACYVYVAERIGALAIAGDTDGVLRWKQIAAKIDQMHAGATN